MKLGQIRQTVSVLCLLAILMGVVKLLPGAGVQQRLDATNGLSDKRFFASRQRAFERMSKPQIEAFEWAVSDLDSETFMKRYGSSPTLRAVVVGEVARFVDAKRKEIAVLEASLQGRQEEIEEAKSRRRSALEPLKTFVPKIVRIGYPSEDAEDKPKERLSCKVGDCDDQNDGYGLYLWYQNENPRNIPIKELPCTLSVQGIPDWEQDFEFDCMSPRRAPNGDHYMILSLRRDLNPSEITASIKAFHEQARQRHPKAYWKSVNAIPGLLPEMAKLGRSKKQMKRALDYKSVM